MILYIFVVVLLSVVIYVFYVYMYSGIVYSKKFNVLLMILMVLIVIVMIVIGNNVVLLLGMVGVLLVVCFRIVIKDLRDIVYIFWIIVVGICCGVGDYVVVVLGSSVIFILLWVMGCVKNENCMLLIVKCDRILEVDLEGIFF